MPFDKNRKSREDKSGNVGKKSFRNDSSDRPYTGRNNDFGKDKKFSERGRDFDNNPKPYKSKNEGSYGNRRSYGNENINSGEKQERPYGSKSNDFGKDKKFSERGRNFDNSPKPYKQKNEGTYGNKRSYDSGNVNSGERKDWKSDRSYSDREKDNDFRKDKKFSGRGRSFDNNAKPYRSRNERTYGNEATNFGERKDRDSDRSYKGKSFKQNEDNGFKKRRYEDQPFEKTDFNREHKDSQVKLRQRKSTPSNSEPKESDIIRLNRYIANSGICSRRKADELITSGHITVNDVVVSELGAKVNPATDKIRYNGEVLKREKMVYILLNKPKDFITTTEDPQERKTVMELVKHATSERIYPVGRLDRNTTGLLLLTNDGDLAEKLSHPRNNITKIYNVELNKNLTQGDFNKIAFGVELEDGFIKPDAVSYVSGGSRNEIGIQIHSGKNRIVRRIFESLEYEVERLDRVIYANLTKKDLPRGKWRFLTEQEIIQLKHFIK